MQAPTQRGEGLSLGSACGHSRARAAGSSVLLVLESWSQLGKSSRAAHQEAAQPWGHACAPRADGGRAPTLGVLPGAAGIGMRWPVALLSQRTLSSWARLGFGQCIRKGRRASCRHEPFSGSPLHPCPRRCIPRAGCNPQSRSNTFSKGKAQGGKGSSEQGGLGKKCELYSCHVSPCFSLSVWGRCPCFRAIQGWGGV